MKLPKTSLEHLLLQNLGRHYHYYVLDEFQGKKIILLPTHGISALFPPPKVSS